MKWIFGWIATFVGIYIFLRWTIPVLITAGILLVVICIIGSKAGGTMTIVQKLNKPKVPLSPSKSSPQIKEKERCREDRDFERRLLRARTEPFEIIAFQGDAKESADILSKNSRKVYRVSIDNCECEDFKERHLPCKHIIYFALQTGRYAQIKKPVPRSEYSRTSREGKWVPFYWDYTTQPTGLGYTNLYPYSVTGRLKGISQKTGRPTNRKKEVMVNACSETDAVAAAQEMGISPPYQVEFVDLIPSEGQYGYLNGARIPYPYLVNSADVSALLTRYEDENDRECPNYLFKMATKYRVRVSYFQEPESVISCIWSKTPDERKPALFCYAVYCSETKFPFGNAPRVSDAVEFAGFTPSKKQLEYILSIEQFGWVGLNKRTTTYQSARNYLMARKMI